jgi:hypothetical protein
MDDALKLRSGPALGDGAAAVEPLAMRAAKGALASAPDVVEM